MLARRGCPNPQFFKKNSDFLRTTFSKKASKRVFSDSLYTNFFAHVLKSANECKFCLGLLKDSNRGDRETVNKLLKEATEIANILATSILTLKGKR
jgi:four helix bundle protein